MGRIATFRRSSLGKKFIVAVTGVLLFGFVVGHMAGNLKVFTGIDADGVPHIDTYAAFLRSMGEPLLPHGMGLWIARVVLIVALVLHVVNVIALARQSRAARPTRYHHAPSYRHASFAARSMMVSGLCLLVFVIIHLLQFTTATIQVTPVEHGAVYANLYYAFSKWFFVAFYVFALVLLGFHVYHGVWSLFQTLGIDNPDRNRMLRTLAIASTLALVVGFCAVPILFFIGVMPEPPAATTDLAAVGGP